MFQIKLCINNILPALLKLFCGKEVMEFVLADSVGSLCVSHILQFYRRIKRHNDLGYDPDSWLLFTYNLLLYRIFGTIRRSNAITLFVSLKTFDLYPIIFCNNHVSSEM